MELLRKTILLENSVDRTADSLTWGVMTAETFYINVMLTQSMDNMGIFADIDFVSGSTNPLSAPDYSILEEKLRPLNVNFNFLTGATATINPYKLTSSEMAILRIPNKDVTAYYNYPLPNSLNFKITGYTDSKIEDLRSYNAKVPFQTGFDMEKADYYNYVNQLVKGVSRIYSMAEPRIYVFDTPTGATLGQSSQVSGLQYIEYTGRTRQITSNNANFFIPQTQFNYVCEGINMTNTSLSAITKEEYLFGAIFPPEVKSEVFIERGITSVMDKHLRLSEVKDLNELARYGNGLYTLNKQ
jgi:hypothetical protein